MTEKLNLILNIHRTLQYSKNNNNYTLVYRSDKILNGMMYGAY